MMRRPKLPPATAQLCHLGRPGLGMAAECAMPSVSATDENSPLGAHLCRALITQVAVFLQTLVNNAFQLGRHIGIQSNGRGWRCIQDGFEDLRRTAATKRERTCRHL